MPEQNGPVNATLTFRGTTRNVTFDQFPTEAKINEAFAHMVAEHYGLNPFLFRNLVWQESRFNPNAVSKAGARGLTQLMPGTAKGLKVQDINDPLEQLDAGARYLKQQLDAFGGDYSKALAAYNGGPKNVRDYNGIPPFPETQKYVRGILQRTAIDEGKDWREYAKGSSYQKDMPLADDANTKMLKQAMSGYQVPKAQSSTAPLQNLNQAFDAIQADAADKKRQRDLSVAGAYNPETNPAMAGPTDEQLATNFGQAPMRKPPTAADMPEQLGKAARGGSKVIQGIIGGLLDNLTPTRAMGITPKQQQKFTSPAAEFLNSLANPISAAQLGMEFAKDPEKTVSDMAMAINPAVVLDPKRSRQERVMTALNILGLVVLGGLHGKKPRVIEPEVQAGAVRVLKAEGIDPVAVQKEFANNIKSKPAAEPVVDVAAPPVEPQTAPSAPQAPVAPATPAVSEVRPNATQPVRPSLETPSARPVAEPVAPVTQGPREFVPPVESAQEPTGMARRFDDPERAAKGLEPLSSEKFTRKELADKGVQRYKELGRDAMDSIIDDAIKGNKALLNEDVAAATAYKRQLFNEIQSLKSKMAENSGFEPDIKAKIESLQNKVDRISQAGQITRNKGFSRLGHALQIAYTPDYSLVGLEAEARSMFGKNVPKDVSETIAKVSKGYEKSLKERDTVIEGLKQELETTSAKLQDALTAKEQTAIREGQVAAKRKKLGELEARRSELVKDFQKAVTKIGSNLDPEAVIKLGELIYNEVKLRKVQFEIAWEGLKKEFPDVFGKIGTDDAQKAFVQHNAAQEVAKKNPAYEKRIAEAGTYRPKPEAKPDIPEIEALKERLRQARKDGQPKRDKQKALMNEDIRALAKAYIKEGASTYEEVIGKFAEDLPKYSELDILQGLSAKGKLIDENVRANRIKIEQAIRQLERRAEFEKQAPAKKVARQMLSLVTDAQRKSAASSDLSAPFVQARDLAVSDPVTWLKGWKPMLEAAKKNDASQIMARIEQHPDYNKAIAAGVSIDTGKFHARPEMWGTKIIEGLDNATGPLQLIKRSDEAYAAFNAYVRMELFSKLAKGHTDPAILKDIARTVNVFTGVPITKTGKVATEVLSNIKFAPGYYVSKYEKALGASIATSTTKTGKIIAAKQSVKTALGYVAILGVIRAFGGKVDTDARSTDFGMAEVDGNRFDVFSGPGKAYRTIVRLFAGSISSSGKKTAPSLQEAGKTIGMEFLQGTNPAISTATKMQFGDLKEESPGKFKKVPFTPKEFALGYAPMGVKDAVTESKQGAGPAAWLNVIGFNVKAGGLKKSNAPKLVKSPF